MTSDDYLHSARQRWLNDEYDAALQQFRLALGASLNDLRLAVEVASYLGLRFEIHEAVSILARCEASLEDHPAGLFEVVLAYDRIYRPDDAIRCLQNLLNRHQEFAPGWRRMAEWHQRRGKLDLAWDCLSVAENSIVDDITKGELQLWRAKLLARRGDFDAAKFHLEAIARHPLLGAKSGTKAGTKLGTDVWYALADVYEQSEQYDIAFDAALCAKQLQQGLLGSHLRQAQQLARLEASYVTTVQASQYENWSQSVQHAPIALLSGPARSGTSLMTRMFGMHPKISVADELPVFPTYVLKEMMAGQRGTAAGVLLDGLAPAHLDACRSRYQRWIGNALDSGAKKESGTVTDRESRPLLDKYPSTTFLIPAFRRLFPHATIIMPIRDPRDVVISSFFCNLPLNPVSAMFSRLELTVARCRAEALAWIQLRERLTPPWHEVRYDDITRRDFNSIRQVMETMGLEWEDAFADYHHTLQAQPARSPTYAQLLQPIHHGSVGRWQRFEQYLSPHLPRLTDIAKTLGFDS